MASPDTLFPLPRMTTPVFAAQVQMEDLAAHIDDIEKNLAAGQRVAILRGERVIGELLPPTSDISAEQVDPTMPDFMGRMKHMWGDRTFGDSTRWIREDRDSGY